MSGAPDFIVAGLKRLREPMEEADFAPRRAFQAFPRKSVQSDDGIQAQIRDHAGEIIAEDAA